MLARTYSAITQGLEPIKIEVEVNGSHGTPNLILIGLPNKSIDEAKERITAAVVNCGFRIKAKRVVVNLAPADVYKSNNALELAIAVGLLAMYRDIPQPQADVMFFGELSLTGEVKPIRGALPLVLAARQFGITKVILPSQNQDEVSVIGQVAIYPVRHLSEVVSLLQAQFHRPPIALKLYQPAQPPLEQDLTMIRGQLQAKRALEVAAAGGHNILLIGPPGAGKSLLSQAFASILPPLTQTEAIEVTQIHSLKGLTLDRGLIDTRPFRAPHHTTSQAGLIGGGIRLQPGEISLSHRGVLFLDELPEFSSHCLEALRQPLEEGIVNISRANGTVRYPARFQLVAAANPCVCGYAGSKKKACSCTPYQRLNYLKRVSGPILDRIDMHVRVQEVETTDLVSAHPTAESSQTVGLRVQVARHRQQDRYQSDVVTNSSLKPSQVDHLLPRTPSAQKLLHRAIDHYGLSARSYFKIIKLARSIADLGDSDLIDDSHVAEALQYRPREK